MSGSWPAVAPDGGLCVLLGSPADEVRVPPLAFEPLVLQAIASTTATATPTVRKFMSFPPRSSR
jgi:hypothetical protein